MGKNSARAKGYRKNQKKSTGYTESEKKIMTIGFLVIVLVIVGVLVLPDWIESFSLLKVKDGVVQGVEDNWLICNLGTSSSPKYRKLAEINPVEGFELTGTNYITDANVPYFVYAPTGDSAAQQMTIQAGNGDAQTLAEKYASSIGAFAEVLYQDEVIHDTVGDREIWAVLVEYRMENYTETETETEADSETEPKTTQSPNDYTDTVEKTDTVVDSEAEPTYTYSQSAIVYTDTLVDGRSIVISASVEGDSEAAFGDREALLEAAKSAVASIELSK